MALYLEKNELPVENNGQNCIDPTRITWAYSISASGRD
jgi:hypothetical protein